MKKRFYMYSFLFINFMLLAGFTNQPKKLNILYIHTHDTGRYIEPYGYDVATPNMQKLAEQGILFRNHFSTFPTCSPSRGCLLTGRYPISNGLYGLAHRGFKLNDYNRHIVNFLKDHGYVSALAGVQHVVDHHNKNAWQIIGYDEHIGGTWSRNDMNKVIEWLENAPEKPFFLSVGFGETHRDFPLHSWQEEPEYVNPPGYLPDVPAIRLDFANYKESARLVDEKMGMIFKALEDNNLSENTLVVCTTEHGIAFPFMKCNLTDGGIGIMLMMRGPNGFTGGKTVTALTSNVDVFPTICDYLGLEKPEWLQGISFMPVIRDEKEEIRKEIFAEIDYHASYEPVRCVRTNRYKYVKRYSDRDKPVLPNCDDSPSKTYLMEQGWQEQNLPKEALYDLIFDPYEKNNLIDDPQKKEIIDDLKSRLKEHMQSTDDPLLTKGYVPAPKGALVNDPDAVSAKGKKVKPKYVE